MPDFLLKPLIKRVRNSAGQNGGQCTWEFSQMVGTVSSIIGTHAGSKDGICEMLSAKWLECHAKEGHLANWIKGSGSDIDPSKVRNLMQLFIIGSEMNRQAIVGNAVAGGTVDQTNATARWLEAKGIRHRKSIKPVQFLNGPSVSTPVGSTGSRGGGARGLHSANIGSAIANIVNTGTGSYRMIGIYGPGGAHAMAAWVGADVAFFDPNFGEFWFENRRDFIAWFPTFFSKACYSWPKLGLCERFEVDEFALAA